MDAQNDNETTIEDGADTWTGPVIGFMSPGADEVPESARRRVLDALEVIPADQLGGLSVTFNDRGGAQVAMHDHSWVQVLVVADLVGLTGIPDDYFPLKKGHVVVRFASLAHLRGGMSLTWYTDEATARQLGLRPADSAGSD